MNRDALLIEIGCEEIPARMIRAATEDLARRIGGILDQADLARGEARFWGGSRRLAVHVDAVQSRQEDRDEQLLGPPAKVAFDASGAVTKAAAGFARKQGIDPSDLTLIETERGSYAGVQRVVPGRSVGEILAANLPQVVESMWFPKTMRWGEGRWRWVRPVHWVVALHGSERLPVELFGCRASDRSVGHRFLSNGEVTVADPESYCSALESVRVIIDPEERKRRLELLLQDAASGLGGRVRHDPSLLDEVANLVEWPGVVAGSFDEHYLQLPTEILITTLRHHQKCFAVENKSGQLAPAFLAVANTDSDPSGHIRRGNEWVVRGRLEDARFFWLEDRKQPLEQRSPALNRVQFHARLGSYADKAQRMEQLTGALSIALGLSPAESADARACASLAKNDLVTGTVGEFPELQGKVGGLMLRAEGVSSTISDGVYSHYQPAGAQEPIPPTTIGCVVSLADKLDTLSELIRIGEVPSGSRDPFGLRRATSGLFRIVLERGWPLSLRGLVELCGETPGLHEFLVQRLQNFLRDAGSTPNEVQAVFRAGTEGDAIRQLALHDIAARVAAIARVRAREDFVLLADLTKRVDNILVKNSAQFEQSSSDVASPGDCTESVAAALELERKIDRTISAISELETAKRYADVVDILAEFVRPVEKFFDDVLVIDPDQPQATLRRLALLERLRQVLTRYFDIRELAGQAGRS